MKLPLIYLFIIIVFTTIVPINAEKLNGQEYKIILIDSSTIINHYYIYLNLENPDKTTVQNFINAFRKHKAPEQANIFIYDKKNVRHLFIKLQLRGKDYITLADHFVACSTFDDPYFIYWYPFQNIYYKEQGGKNWKKEPILD